MADPDQVIRRLNLALAGFDRAAIHTIHGFCQRVLVENAFETSQPFEMQLVPDQDERLQQIADDFWRIRIDELPISVTARLLQRYGGPEGLLRRVVKALGKPYLDVRGAQWPEGLEEDGLREAHHENPWEEAIAPGQVPGRGSPR